MRFAFDGLLVHSCVAMPELGRRCEAGLIAVEDCLCQGRRDQNIFLDSSLLGARSTRIPSCVGPSRAVYWATTCARGPYLVEALIYRKSLVFLS